MNLIKLYEWLTGTQSQFTKPFQHDEVLYNQARLFWTQLDGTMVWIVMVMLIISIGMAYIYYKPFNNMPGRHYTFKYWALFLFLTSIASGIITYILEYYLCKPRLFGANSVEVCIAVANALYSIVIFIVTSLAWCKFYPTSTNAYTWFKRA